MASRTRRGPVLTITGLQVSDDQGNPAVRGVDLEVRAGEILGIAGVAGNGQDELVEAIIGLRKVAGGRDRRCRARTSPRTPRAR